MGILQNCISNWHDVAACGKDFLLRCGHKPNYRLLVAANSIQHFYAFLYDVGASKMNTNFVYASEPSRVLGYAKASTYFIILPHSYLSLDIVCNLQQYSEWCSNVN